MTDEQREQKRRWRMQNRTRVRAAARRYRRKRPDKFFEINRRYQQKVKAKVMLLYGDGHCTGCGQDDLCLLTIEHLNGDGGVDRERHQGNGFYQHLLRSPKRNDLTCLCISCQWRKKRWGSDFLFQRETVWDYLPTQDKHGN